MSGLPRSLVTTSLYLVVVLLLHHKITTPKMNHLALTRLYTNRVDFPKLQRFYTEALGMTEMKAFESQTEHIHWFGFGKASPSSMVEFRYKKDDVLRQYRPTRNDAYWKIGLSVQDAQLARNRLVEKHGVRMGQAHQFLDIGFLVHLSDPMGYTVELLQHDFEQNFRPVTPDDSPLGQPATIGQISLRVKEPNRSIKFYKDLLGMSYLSLQDVGPYGFNLHFFAYTNDQPPNPNVEGVENREWLWKKPYTQIELQYIKGTEFNPTLQYQLPDTEKEAGFAGVGICVDASQMDSFYNNVKGTYTIHKELQHNADYNVRSFEILDPDNIPVVIMEKVL